MASVENPNLELLTLIWLDKLANATTENRHIQEKLRGKINYLRIFDNSQDCEHYIRNVIDDKQEKLILIVSGRLGPEITERVHDLKQIVSIYVFCFDQQKNELWASKYKKIRGVIKYLPDLLNAIDRDQKSDEQKLNESIEILTTEDQILSLLLQIKLSLRDKRDFLDICSKEYLNNTIEMNNINDFEHLYIPSNALDYFFNETFLYRLLMKSLHTFNIKLLYLLRFFLQDIDRQLQIQSKINGKIYRGQLMTTIQVEFLTQIIEKQFIRFNTLFIGNLNQEQVRQSLQKSYVENNLQKVLFEIEDKYQIGRQYKQYCIFPITTTFRITSVQLEQRIWIVQITVCNNSNQFRSKKERTPLDLAHYLRETNQLNHSEKLYELFLTQYPSLKAECYDGLGRIAQDKGHYDVSLSFYLKSLQTISLKKRSNCLNNIACAYDYLGQYEEAIQFYSEALSLMKTDLEQSMCLNNMGITYANDNQFEQAFKCFQRSLTLRKPILVENHPDTGICHTNLGVVYATLAQFDYALENYNLALKAFASNKFYDISRAIVYQNIAQIHQQNNQIDQALKLYQNAHTIFQKFRPIDHPNLLYIQQQIDQIKKH
ncbi:hypothetical protein I4U23_006085 [Adineta vaga]|nr:hypothetical protein I4U23_006085 [Adineta vaga]